MKDQIREIINRANTAARAGLLVREYLQARMLEALQRTGAFASWAFLGGTALRFLYRLPRFSEDLDFSRNQSDGPSLLSGKLYALMHRPHVNGRDVYDLFWYLSDPTWPAPGSTRWNGIVWLRTCVRFSSGMRTLGF